MTLTISIPPEAEERLRQQADAAGAELSAYISMIVEQAANRASLNEILQPLRGEFAAKGVSEPELLEQIVSARDAHRAERRQRPA